jgi:signal transduction histidine kinase
VVPNENDRGAARPAGLRDATLDAVLREHVRIRVSDTGIGIPPYKLNAIFEPFVQVRSDLTRTADGVALGSAISRDPARAMGGDLTVESMLGAGSTVTVELPVA